MSSVVERVPFLLLLFNFCFSCFSPTSVSLASVRSTVEYPLSSLSSVSGLLLRYRHEFWHFCRIPSSVYLASLRSAVGYPLDSRGQVVARPVAKVE